MAFESFQEVFKVGFTFTVIMILELGKLIVLLKTNPLSNFLSVLASWPSIQDTFQ